MAFAAAPAPWPREKGEAEGDSSIEVLSACLRLGVARRDEGPAIGCWLLSSSSSERE